MPFSEDPGRRLRWLLPAAVVAGTFLAFAPVLASRVFHLDDVIYLGMNSSFKTLSWGSVAALFSPFQSAPGGYEPLFFLACALIYRGWGLDPLAFHLSTLLLHCAGTLLFYLTAKRLLAAGRPGAGRDPAAWCCAAFAALMFGMHPQRIEVVAWAEQLAYALSAAFAFASVALYLRAVEAEAPLRGWLAASLAFFACSLASLPVAAALPAALVVLDVYPLRRLDLKKSLLREGNARVLAEKVPFFLVSAAFVALSFHSRAGAQRVIPWEQFGFLPRLAHTVFGISHYLERTLVPYGLCPWVGETVYYAGRAHPLDMLCSLRTILALAVTVFALKSARRRPAVPAAWLCYLLLLAPLTGFSKHENINPLVFDKWYYLAAAVWPVLAGAAAYRFWRAARAGLLGAGTRKLLLGGAAGLLALWGVLSWRQTRRWSDPVELFQHCVDTNPRSIQCHLLLAESLVSAGRNDEAIRASRDSLGFEMTTGAYHHLLLAYAGKGSGEEAARTRAKLKTLNPGATAKFFLDRSRVLSESGDPERAREALEEAAEIDPGHWPTQMTLGVIYGNKGLFEEAEERTRAAIRANPGHAPLHNNLGYYLQRQGRQAEAAAEFREALRLDPGLEIAGNNLAAAEKASRAGASRPAPGDWRSRLELGMSFARRGLLDRAIETTRLAVRDNPASAPAHNNLGYFLQAKGLLSEAARAFEEALRLDPGLDIARNNLASVRSRLAAAEGGGR